MNKKELTAQVARQAGLTNLVALKAIDAVFQSIKENLTQGESTAIQGFGTFSVGHRGERMGVDPSTKQPMVISARKVVKFSASKTIELT